MRLSNGTEEAIMNRMKAALTLSAVLLGATASAPALAWHHGRVHFGVVIGAPFYPWYYPPYPPYYGYYPPYYGYSYDSPHSGGGQDFDYQYWTNLAASVQSELTRRGYYHGPTDGVIGSDSSEAIRAFQAAQGLPVTGRIDPKLLRALGIRYRSA